MSVTRAYVESYGILEKTGGLKLLSDLHHKSPHTERHSHKVAWLGIGLSRSFDELPKRTAVQLGVAGLLHDVGKAHPDIVDLVEASRELTDEERAKVVKVHTVEGSRLIAPLTTYPGYHRVMSMAAYVALYHHVEPPVLYATKGSTEETEITNLVHVIDRFEALQDPTRPYRTRPAAKPYQAAELVASEVEIQPFLGIEPETIMTTLIQLAT